MSFAPGVKCLAYHGPLLYEAKILKCYDPKTRKVSDKDGEKPIGNTIIPPLLQTHSAYFIHYKGWKASWDEWVGKERILELNQENIQKQKHLKDSVLNSLKDTGAQPAGGSGTNSTSTSTTKSSSSNNTNANSHNNHSTSSNAVASKSNSYKDDHHDGDTEHIKVQGRRKRGHEEIEKSEDFFKKPEVHFTISSSLKTLLVNDWEYITKNHQLVPLPRELTVADLLEKFRVHYTTSVKKKLNTTEHDILEEVLSGLKVYFDSALGHILLYRYERQQYKDIIHNEKYQDKAPSEIYGAEHLLRLFVSLPGLIAQTSMDQQSIGILKTHLEEFIRFLDINKDTFFITQYENTSPAYDSLSRT